MMSGTLVKVLRLPFLVQMLSQDLLNASLQIPFSVPPYMSLLARAVATLEGIALSGNPQYQMVAEVCCIPLKFCLSPWGPST